MATSCFLCVFLICIAVSHGYHSNIGFKSKNGSMLNKSTNDIGTSSAISNTEFFDKEKKIIAHKNEMTKECVLKLVDDQTNILNFKNNYDQNMELTEDEMVEIIGENLRNFCKDKIIILNNFDNNRFSRSKRSTEKKRYQGQTQTQFVSFGSKNSNQETKNGLAEALSQPDLSRATVSGLNGMGQAQSQSSFGECDECPGQDYRTHSTQVDNSHLVRFPSLRPTNSVPQNENSRPYSISNTNRQAPGLQNEENQREHSINGQYPDTYPGSGTNIKLPGNQDHGYGVRPLVDGQYRGSGTNNKLPGNQYQGYGITPSIDGQYTSSGTNNKLPGNQNQGYGINPSIVGQYPGLGTNNNLPGNRDNGYGNEPYSYGQYPDKNQGSDSKNTTELGNIDSGRVYSSANEQNPNLANTNSPEFKKNVNNDAVNPNTYSINSSPFNPSSWEYANKIDSNNPNLDQQINQSGFPNIPSGLGHGILTPHNTPNSEWTRPSYNPQVPVTTSIGHQNKPANYPPIFIPNHQQQMPNVLGQLTPSMPISSDANSQNEQRIKNEAAGTIHNGYPLSSNIHGGQDYTTLNLPSLCNFLYQTCLNAMSNNKKLNEFQITNSQNNERIPNEGKQVGITQVPITQQQGYPLYGGGNNQNQIQPSYGLPQDTLGSGVPYVQHPGYTPSGVNLNPIQTSYGQPQSTLGSGGSGYQQPGYASSGGNINQIQPSYGQSQGALGTGGSGVQQPGYIPSGGNINQIQPSYGHSQGTLGSGGTGYQQPGYASSGGNINSIQPSYSQPQGTLGSGGSGYQQPGYASSGGNINQFQPSFGQPHGTLGSGGSGYQQPGYASSGGNINQNQIQPSYGQSHGTLGSGGIGYQQPGYASSGGNLNPIQPSYGQPQSTLSSGGSGVQQSGNVPSGGNINQIQPQGTLGSGGTGVQQPGYASSGRNINQIQPQGTLGSGGSGVQQSGNVPSGVNINQIQPSYGQPHGTLYSGGTGVQQPGYASSGENLNPIQPSYGQPHGTLGSGGSGVQQSGNVPSGVNINQIQPTYGQPQGTLGSGGSGVQQSGNVPSGGNINQIQPQGTLGSGGSGYQQPGYASSGGNLNQIQPSYGQPHGTLGTGGTSVQQPGYASSGGNLNPIQPSYGQPQGTLGSGGSGVQQSGNVPSGVNINQIQPSYGQPHGTLYSGGTGVQQPGYASSGGNLNPIQPSYGQPHGTLGSGGSGVQQSGNVPSGVNINQIQPTYGQPQGTLGSGGSGVQQSGNVPSGVNINQIQPSYGQPQGTLGSGGSGVQQSGIGPSGVNINQIQPTYGQPQGTLGSDVQQSGNVPSGVNINPIQPSYGQPQGTLGSGGSGVQQSGNVPSGVNINQMQPNYDQPQDTLGSGGTGVQQPGYNLPPGEPNRNRLSSVQSPLDGKRVPQSYPGSYGDNSFRGPSLKPESDIGNINPSLNPIIGGQFGTDISSGGSVTPIDTEGGDAQSMTNVDVDGQETRASASAQGKSKTGMSQTQVSGSYLGTGTFSAQAQTSDSDKGAQSQIVSNTNGTTSTAQGKGGRGQAQSQVLYNSDNGIALGEAQSSGINYGTNTQLQAGIKGGVADAQSTGPGSTSSQAQIGFLPQESNNSTNQKSLFKGSGATSAQAGSYSGQSQSQLFGSYKHGISYNGAAQASSGKKLQNLPKLNMADAKLKIGQLERSYNEVKNQTNALPNVQPIPNVLRSQNQVDNSNVDNQKQQNISSTQTPSILPQESSKNIDVYPEYEDNDEYDEDSDESVNTKSVQTKKETIPKQEQNIILKLDDKHDAQITRDSDSQLKSGQVLDAGQVIPGTNGTKIPNGFRGRVASVAGDHTEAKAIPGGQAQTQTVFLTPGVGSLTVVDKTKLRAQLNKESYVKPIKSFKTEINGGIGKFQPDEKNVQYFTKSSTCGYFSFSCNYVNGAKDGPKICKPNPPPFPCQRTNN
ncbi:uncharacterized protein LOC103310238 isoform X5 [Acyrthosiphon pisum]|uniref:Uncharacterized protein n=1 Tax=Acyrthosiphon pisum TaxID=7029 RepID=A0A8R2H6P8_ACYPI|nr:uncharacterized protein LOC103310238 isoform X5 [Acyrthosiphon pisum]|eukprot:XP_016662361.1 PREDICTED: hornerin isoform X4 [Acyrthosiphon pisum]